MTSLICPLCGSGFTKFLWKKSDAQYVKCQSCGLVFQDPQPTQEQLRALYSENYFVKPGQENSMVGYEDYLHPSTSSIANEIFSTLEEFASGDRRRLLDIGCATGNLLQIAKDHGWETWGIEISSWAGAIAKQRGLEVYGRPLKECQFPSSFFHFVTMFDVIEHLPNPRAEMHEIQRVLSPSGYLILETPNIEGLSVRLIHGVDSELVQPDAHLVLFSKQTLRRLLDTTGFEILRMKTFPLTRSFRTYLRMAVRRGLKRILKKLGYRVGPFDFRARVACPDDVRIPKFTVDDCIQVIARKKRSDLC